MTLREPVDQGVSPPPERVAPSLRALFELAFRPLYLAGTAWALIAIGIWIYAPQQLTGPLQGIAWHAHEMLWGFIATIAVAFLMTACATWTGINPLQGGALGIACGLWLIARIGFLADGEEMFWIAAAAELGFFVLASVAMMRAVYRARNVRNYAVPWLIVGLAAADGWCLLAVLGGDFTLWMQRFDVGLLAMALITLLITRRVIPFFAMRAIVGLTLPMQTRTGQAQLGVCLVAVIGLLAGLRLPTAIALGIIGAVSLVQLVRWRPYTVRAYPLLWILYTGYAGLGVGLVLAACALVGVAVPNAVPVHMIAMAGFSVLIIGMVTRTALGHLGRPLVADRSMRTSYILMLMAVVFRIIATAPSAFGQQALHLSAAAWIAALALYLWRFAPLLIRPRS